MERTKASDNPPELLDLSREHQHEHINRRSFLNGAGRFAVGALTAGSILEIVRPDDAWASPEPRRRASPEPSRRGQQTAKVSHPASARVLARLRNQFTFQISVDVATVEQGLRVAGAALAGGITIVEMGTPLLKNEGVSNVVPAFRRKFPDALLLADMKTMDGGAFEARAVYAGGGNIVDFLALAGVDTAKASRGSSEPVRLNSSRTAQTAFAVSTPASARKSTMLPPPA